MATNEVPTASNFADLSDLTARELTKEANECLTDEDYPGAYPFLAKLAERGEADAQAYVIAGIVARKIEQFEEAARHFEKALAISPDDFSARHNLATLETAAGEYDRALPRLRELAYQRPDDAGIQNDLAVLWLNKKQPARAEAAFYRAIRLDANCRQARDSAMQFFLDTKTYDRATRFLAFNETGHALTCQSRTEIDKWKSVLKRRTKPGFVMSESAREVGYTPADLRIGKMAFFASQRTFIQDVAAALSESNEIRFFEGDSAGQIADLMDWADVAWFEWCDALLIEATRLPKKCPIICRLHSYEAFTDMPEQVDWSKVDHLVLVNESVREILGRRIDHTVPISVIHNGVDLARFPAPENKSYGKKIASVGYINYKKNPALLLYCFKKIHEYDPEYTFHIAGTHQDPRIALYFEHFLKQNPLPIQWDGWVEDMPGWYADKDFVISTSLFESFHYSIAEGMASGLMPLIHDWFGASNLYPKEYLFADPDECLRLLTSLGKSNRREKARRNRGYIARRFNQRNKLDDIIRLLRLVTDNTTKRFSGE